MVVNLAVENDGRVAIVGNDRLVAGLQIENRKARCTQRTAVGPENALDPALGGSEFVLRFRFDQAPDSSPYA